MTDWYYHAPGQGRVGPLSADDMRRLYRERKIVRDTLAWHEGLREWQPLERLIEELGLTGVQPDLSKPPPPPPPPQAATASHATRPTVPIEAPPSNRAGCIIALVVGGIAAMVMLAILAAIALPAYQDYVRRAKEAQQGQTAPGASPGVYDADRMQDADAIARELMQAAMREFYVANNGVCPDDFEFDRLMVRSPRLQGSQDGWVVLSPATPQSGVCAYTGSFRGLGPEVADRKVQYELSIAGDEVGIDCRNLDVPVELLPPDCGG